MTTPLSPAAQAVMDAFPATTKRKIFTSISGEQHAGLIAAAAASGLSSPHQRC
jgi:hypothetical protein